MDGKFDEPKYRNFWFLPAPPYKRPYSQSISRLRLVKTLTWEVMRKILLSSTRLKCSLYIFGNYLFSIFYRAGKYVERNILTTGLSIQVFFVSPKENQSENYGKLVDTLFAK